MALESAQFVNQLVQSNPTSNDPIRQGDDHVRMIKSTLKNTFPNLDAAVTATPAQLNKLVTLGATGNDGYVPRRGIILWSGTIAEIPAGWFLCDGQNGTPDLRGLFIVGAGGDYAVGDTGGLNNVTLTTAQIPSHSHTFSGSTASAGNHSHSGSIGSNGNHRHTMGTQSGIGDNNTNSDFLSRSISTNSFGTPYTSFAGEHSHSLSINSAGNHAHSFSGNTNSAGSGDSHENRPPFYALAFIMKG